MILSLLTTLTLTTPVLNVDGSALDDLATIWVYQVGITEPVRIQDTTEIGTELSFDMGLFLDRRCWYATASDTAGNESPNSTIVCYKSRWRCYKCHE